MKLSETQRKYLIHDQVIGGGIFNGLLNALLAWLAVRKHDSVPMTGDPSIVSDTIGTMVLMPLLICVIVTPLVRKAIQAGKVEPLSESSSLRTTVLWLPSLSFLRGLVLSLACLALWAPPFLGLLMLAGVDALSVGAFVTIKALYAGALAGIVSYVVALYVLASSAPAQARAGLEVGSPFA